jgi:hypothetical protein
VILALSAGASATATKFETLFAGLFVARLCPRFSSPDRGTAPAILATAANCRAQVSFIS